MRLSKSLAFLAVSALALSACGSGGGGGDGSRSSIRAVGSSTVYPFAKAVAESLSRSNSQFPSPLIESTGTGAGINLFCAGVGTNTPDVANASRRMKKSEFDQCQASKVTEIVEIQIGLDGLAFASAKNGIDLALTPEIVYKALAANPYGKPQTAQTWADVDPSLPDEPILVYGPPSTSGTRDSLKELILTVGCDSNPEMKALKDSDEDRHEQVCTEVRNDGKYVDQGEQDNLIVQKIEGNPKAIGVFGYSYLEENIDKLKGETMNGVAPTYENITSGTYPGARQMFIYVKKAHLDVIPGLKEFLAEWAKSWGKDGPLAKLGLVAMPADAMAKSEAAATQYTVLDGAELK
jgi:phosphate transport system substrate-binding protein